MADGWVKIHRKMLEWEWWDEPNTFKVFMVLLLKTNHKDTSHRGVNIKRGQLKTGRKQLAKWSKLSEMKVRTALNNLVSTNDITINATTKHSIITITNWSDYQKKDNDQPSKQPSDNQDLTNDQPTLNQRLTTSKNDNNLKNDKNNSSSVREEEVKIVSKYTNIFLKTLNGYVGHIQLLSQESKDTLVDIHRGLMKHDFDAWENVCNKVLENDFYLGSGRNKWIITLDWLANEKNVVKILNSSQKPETKDDEIDYEKIAEEVQAKKRDRKNGR